MKTAHRQPPSWWTIARAVHPEPTLKGAGDRLLFLWRIAWCWRHATAWRAWLADSPLAVPGPAAPGLYKKIIRPYFLREWGAGQKLRALREHYEYLFTRLEAGAIRRTCTLPGLPLLHFAMPDGSCFRVFFGHEGRFNKEGELSLLLYSERHRAWISSLTTLVVRRPAGGHGLAIGGLQGLPEGADKNMIKEVAKSLHGLRPKALLLFLAQELAAAWELREITGISNRRHISRHAAYALNRSRRPKLNYDEFWTESGGVLRADGLFALPLRHVPRDLAELKPGKRPLYRRRYELLENLRHEFAAELALLALARPEHPTPRRSPAARPQPFPDESIPA